MLIPSNVCTHSNARRGVTCVNQDCVHWEQGAPGGERWALRGPPDWGVRYSRMSRQNMQGCFLGEAKECKQRMKEHAGSRCWVYLLFLIK